jgi:hypothetical protein
VGCDGVVVVWEAAGEGVGVVAWTVVLDCEACWTWIPPSQCDSQGEVWTWMIV